VAANQKGLNPNIWENPDEFYGFRSAELRSSSKEDAKNTSSPLPVEPTRMSFWPWQTQLPWSVFASNESKTILAYLIRKYDIKTAADR
jgi:hypothetical protein